MIGVAASPWAAAETAEANRDGFIVEAGSAADAARAVRAGGRTGVP